MEYPRMSVEVEKIKENEGIKITAIFIHSKNAAPLIFRKIILLNAQKEFDPKLFQDESISAAKDCPFEFVISKNHCTVTFKRQEKETNETLQIAITPQGKTLLGQISTKAHLTIKTCNDIQTSNSMVAEGLSLTAQNIDLQKDITLQNEFVVNAKENFNNSGGVHCKETVCIVGKKIDNQGSVEVENEFKMTGLHCNNKGIISGIKRVKLDVHSLENTGSILSNWLKINLKRLKVKKKPDMKQQAEKVRVCLNNSGKLVGWEKLSVNSDGPIRNELNGTLFSNNKATILSAANVKNCDTLYAKKGLVVFGEKGIENTEKATITSEEIVFDSSKDLNNKGIVAAGKKLTANIKGNVENFLKGNIASLGSLLLVLEGNIKNAGDIIAVAETSISTRAKIINAITGKILSENELVHLTSWDSFDNFGTISAFKHIATLTGKTMTNQSNAVMLSKASLSLMALKNLINYGDIIGAKLVKAEAYDTFTNSQGASIQSKESLELFALNTINNAGKIYAETDLCLSGGNLVNQILSGEIVSLTNLHIHLKKQFINAHHVHADQKSKIECGLLINDRTGRITSDTSEIFSASVQNAGLVKAKNLSARTINLLKNKEGGQLVADEQLFLESMQRMENAGLMLGKHTVLDAYDFQNSNTVSSPSLSVQIKRDFEHCREGQIIVNNTLIMSAGNLAFLGKLWAGGDVSANVTGRLDYNTESLWATGLLKLTLQEDHNFTVPLSTPGLFSLNALFAVKVNTTLQFGQDAEISVGNLDILRGGIYSGGKLNIAATYNLRNFPNTYLVSQGDQTLKSDIILNRMGEYFTASNLHMQALHSIENNGHINVQGNAYIKAPSIKHRMLLYSPTLNVQKNCTLEGNAHFHEAILGVGGQFNVIGTFTFYSRELEEQKAAYAREMEAHRKRAKRKRKRALFKSVMQVVVGIAIAWACPVVAPNFFAGIGGAIAKGAVIGGVSSAAGGKNPLKGAITGAFFAGFGAHMNVALEVKVTSEALRQALIAGATAGLHTAIHGGKLAQNILISMGASALSSAVIPDRKELGEILSSNKLTMVARDEMLRAVITGGLTSIVSRTGLAQNLISAGIGAAQSFAEQHGRNVGQKRLIAQEVAAQPKQNRSSHKPETSHQIPKTSKKFTEAHHPKEPIKPKNLPSTFKGISDELHQFYTPGFDSRSTSAKTRQDVPKASQAAIPQKGNQPKRASNTPKPTPKQVEKIPPSWKWP